MLNNYLVKKNIVFTSFLLIHFSCSQLDQEDYTQFVNPLIGSDSSFKLSNGNTYPAIALPWGMNFWTPQTGEMGNGWIYTCLLYTSPSPRDGLLSRMPSSA